MEKTDGGSLSVTSSCLQESDDGAHGVLLYYKFVPITCPKEIQSWLFALCSSLDLLGRIRVAKDGINVTVGGKMTALHKHMKEVDSHTLFNGCDFKLSVCPSPVSIDAAEECGFTTLSVRLVKELVSLNLNQSLERPSIARVGKHLSAQQFHETLQNACSMGLINTVRLASGSGGSLDDEVHNDSLGKEIPWKKVVVLDTRNIYETRIGKFCPPDGIEFLDPKVRQYSDLPAWIDKNEDVLCNNRILMYCTGGVRCEMASAYIRMKGKGYEDVLQLSGGIQRYLEVFPDGGFFKGKNFVFDHRIAVASSNKDVVGTCLVCKAPFDDYSAKYRCSICRLRVLVCENCQAKDQREELVICELCSKDEEVVKSSKEVRKLRILCLHGFRQSASSLKGRLGGFRKKLKHKAEFFFADGPHEISPITQQPEILLNSAKKYAWLICPDAVHRGTGSGQGAQPNPRAINVPTLNSIHVSPVPSKDEEDQLQSKPALDHFQYQTQAAGWEKSWSHLQKLFSEMGPFDGVLGFSQGAAVAGALCSYQGLISQPDGRIGFSFVILCSGFPSPVPEHQHAMSFPAVFDFPSLHIFGSRPGGDRQIDSSESERLASMFSLVNRMIVRHDAGHIIPTQREHTQKYLDFLSQF